MSIKIGNGYRIDGIDSIEALYGFCGMVSEDIRGTIERAIAGVMGAYLTMEFDLATAVAAGMIPDDARPLRVGSGDGPLAHAVISMIAGKMYKASNGVVTDPEFDMSANLSIFKPVSYMDGSRHFMPVMLFTSRREIRDTWERMVHVKDFAYDTRTDPPDGVGPEEWAKRGRVWNALLKGHAVPASCSLSYQLHDAMAPFGFHEKIARVLDAAPDPDARVRSMIRAIVSHEKSMEASGGRQWSEIPVDEKIRSANEIAVWLHKNMDTLIAERAPGIRRIMVEKLTLERVMQPIEQAL